MVDWENYALTARKMAAEGCVLIKNDNQVLPLKKNEKLAVFGINAFHYYKSGLGSGGMVNTRYVVTVMDALREEGVILDEELIKSYEQWIEKNPFDEGHGWGTTPWSQNEMPLTQEMVDKAHEKNDIAVIMIGRTAGEDQDNTNSEKSYLLSALERDMLDKVCKTFEKTVVLLNVGNIIDMKWVEQYNPSSVMYIWQGGQEGGHGVIDVLTGRVNPCGKLTDTIAVNVDDYLSDNQFGHEDKNYYEEDVFVGYRYFSSVTAAKDKVLYPFGFGLSYTTFETKSQLVKVESDKITVEAVVTNTGSCAGKESVQVYVEAPQGRLCKPLRALVGFDKTQVLEPGKSEKLVIECGKEYFASFDEDGRTGHESCFILEQGEYKVYAGTNVEAAVECGRWNETDTSVIRQCSKALAPVESFERFILKKDENGDYVLDKESVKATPYDVNSAVCDFKEIKQNAETDYKLMQVHNGEVSMEDFIAQFTDDDLIHIARGEGMCSMKVTPGTAGAFGGLTPHLKEMGIPALCCADGPSGIRMDCGTKAFSLPSGAIIACSFNVELTKELFRYVGTEIKHNKVDTILGPGINIHRHPLNGRNFEYFSEDPFLTGKMCVAQLEAMHESGVTGTIKHFCANNQEKRRHQVQGIISERALREIYLKPFEIAVREANARSVMTTYGPVNGFWTAGSYDLCTKILRGDWGYKGIVMSDWWAIANWYGEEPDRLNRAAMAIAQNDIFMPCSDTIEENNVDNMVAEFKSGRLTRAMLQRNAKNVLEFALQSPAMERLINRIENSDEEEQVANGSVFGSDDFACFQITDEMERVDITVAEHPEMLDEDGAFFGLILNDAFEYDIAVTYKTVSGELAQINISLYTDNIYKGSLALRGTGGNVCEYRRNIEHFAGPNHYVKLVFKANEIDIQTISFIKR